jgi:hypothetical protein
VGKVAGAGRAGGPSDAEVAVGVPGQGLRHAERADHLAGDLDQPVGDLAVILLDAAVGQHAGGEEQVADVVGGGGHRLVGEVDQHRDDADRASQWRPLGGGVADARQ